MTNSANLLRGIYCTEGDGRNENVTAVPRWNPQVGTPSGRGGLRHTPDYINYSVYVELAMTLQANSELPAYLSRCICIRYLVGDIMHNDGCT
ncbi:hypothetical protein EVAR_11012_1 [Eumeta japonica]|uniref:Uncharacterized protein n=1 Tax=Eumeta variegata TaxID=151549 RepID=A0A4C1YLE1_EUMVA|nr:hypothetical protein EVAR_11012_1 [Eumeta japonica]